MSPRLRQAKQRGKQPASFKAKQTAFPAKLPEMFVLISLRFNVLRLLLWQLQLPLASNPSQLLLSAWRQQTERGALIAIIWAVITIIWVVACLNRDQA